MMKIISDAELVNIRNIALGWNYQAMVIIEKNRIVNRIYFGVFLFILLGFSLSPSASEPSRELGGRNTKQACSASYLEVLAESCPDENYGSTYLGRRINCNREKVHPWRKLANTCKSNKPNLPQSFCSECLTITVGPPRVVRGPFRDELDTNFTAVKLPKSGFRVFSSANTTFAIDTPSIFSLRGQRTRVAGPGELGSGSDCGAWLNHVVERSGNMYGFFHIEGSCDRSLGQTNKALALGISNDNGLHWRPLGKIVEASQRRQARTVTGVGDCSIVNGHDSYLYAYCLRARDWRTIVARAPAMDFSPGKWHKWNGVSWSEPGLGGDAKSLGIPLATAAWWEDEQIVFLIGSDRHFGGLRLWLSPDKHTAVPLAEPLIDYDDYVWKRPSPSAMYAYPGIVNETTGKNEFGNKFVLTYTYLPENKTFRSRYLVMHNIYLNRAPSRSRGMPQVKRAMSLWIDKLEGRRLLTSAPVVGDYLFQKVVGYAMTRPLPRGKAVRIDECSPRSDHDSSSIIAAHGDCVRIKMRRLRPSGWILRDKQANTVPLYLCESENRTRHRNALEPGCAANEKSELIGYLIK